MPKLATPLTDKQIKNLKAGDKPKKYSDGGGLYLHVYPIGSKLWQMDYRYYGRRKTLSFGAYPAIGLKDARGKRDNAKKLLSNGIDPSEYKKKLAEDARKAEAKRAEAQGTFEIVAREWHAKQTGVWTEGYKNKILARFEKNIFHLLGDRSIKTIEASEILDVLRKIEDRGAIETAHRTLQNFIQIFRYAIATGRAERDPAADLKGALKPVKQTNYASITDPKEISHLLRSISNYQGSIIVKAALSIIPYVFVRPSELRHAEWQEIDFDKAEWRISASNMKIREMQHIVPLATQAIEILKELRAYTGHSQYVFPSPRSNTAPISDMALLNAIRKMGYDKNTMTVHGFRSMASTLLNDLGYNSNWIERQLAYSKKNSVRAAYNYAEYLPERRRMMQEWANYLDAIKAKKWGTVFAYKYIKPRMPGI